MTGDVTEPTAVVIGIDAQRVGEIVADLEARGVRAAAFIGDPAQDTAALTEMLAELFGHRGEESMGKETP